MLGLYHGGSYPEAAEMLKKLRDTFLLSWWGLSDLHFRCSYIAVKLFDKLEQWSEMRKYHDNSRKAFRYPRNAIVGKAYDIYWTQYCTALALPFIRCGNLEGSHEYIQNALQTSPPDNSDSLVKIAYADRLTIRAIVRLAQYLYRSRENSAPGASRNWLWEAECDFAEAELWLRDFGNLGKTNESHLTGRFFGARAFVFIARHYDDVLSDAEFEKTKAQLCQWANRAAEKRPGRRYGGLAGRYCQAYTFLWLSRKSATDTGKRLAEDGLGLVQSTLDDGSILGTMAKLKFARVGQKLADRLDRPRVKRAMERSFIKSRESSDLDLRNRIDNEIEKWLQLPLN
jgi:hypothetical protein